MCWLSTGRRPRPRMLEHRRKSDHVRIYLFGETLPVSRQKSRCRNNLRIAETQRSYKCCMHLRRGYTYPIEFKVVCGAGIVNHRRSVTEVHRSARNRVNAHVTHISDDNDSLDTLILKNRLQVGFAEGIHVVFDDHTLAGQIRSLRIKLSTFSIGYEKRGILCIWNPLPLRARLLSGANARSCKAWGTGSPNSASVEILL
jgi:hypothetical protein